MRIKGPSGDTPQPQPEKTYRTQKGDTLRLVASKFQLDPEALKTANNLKQGIDDKFRTGRELVIPGRQIIDAIIKPQHEGVAGVRDDIVKAEPRANPFEAESPVADIYDDPWAEWDPYDPDGDWGERSPDKLDVISNPADLIKKKQTGE